MKNGHYEASDIKPLDKKGLGITQEQIYAAADRMNYGYRGELNKKAKKK